MNKIEELLKTFYYHDPDELGEDAFNNLGDDEIAEAKQAINAYILGEVMELLKLLCEDDKIKVWNYIEKYKDTKDYTK